MRLKKYFVIVLFYLTGLQLPALSQKVNHHKKSNNKTKNNKPVFKERESTLLVDTITVYNNFDNTVTGDSLSWIQDSIKAEQEYRKDAEEYSRKYHEKMYPKDSLSYVDDAVHEIILENKKASIDSIIGLIGKRFKTALQKSRAIFYWLASTVEYDFESLSNNTVSGISDKALDALITYQKKKGVCQNYANLYKYICDRAGIPCEVIDGNGKNFPYAIKPGDESDHAWNAAKTEKGWILLDVTWAAASMPNVNNFWFSTPPEQFIYSHLPENADWQLMKTKMDKSQFINYPIVSPNFFKSKFDFDLPEYGNLAITSNKFSISKPMADKDYSIVYSIFPYKGDEWRSYMDDMDFKMVETKATPDIKNKIINYEITIPTKGIWWVAASFVQKLKDEFMEEITFPKAILFRVNYK